MADKPEEQDSDRTSALEKKPERSDSGPRSSPPPPSPPDGGLAAWLSVFAAFLLFLLSWGPSTGYGAYQDYYQRQLLNSYSASTLSWIGTLNATLLISTGVLAGPLFDRGYVRHLMVLGAFLTVFGQMMLSLSTEYYQVMLAQGLCAGLGAGLIYVPAIAMVNVNFLTRRALVMGLVTSGASVGKWVWERKNWRIVSTTLTGFTVSSPFHWIGIET